ncbi:inositol monophosphatase family protein [Micromonospora peucetia]|uniref:inositol monophosphatase family protein n=1 Tax=Micromonospora peucetia TaxID=47871 RepID=UPI0022516A10|nr:inositol monophosphatase family protein [Micromonospora peucetia]MCX4388392.1 inositol monophosphatase family protein [Micromonospora peucetia]
MESDLLLARRAALAGATVGMRYFVALAQLPQQLKPDGSVVTAADRAVEAAIREVLAAARPGDAVLGEEEGQTGHGGRRWIVDPIDGTALFVAGDDRWLVLVALEEAGEIVVGVAAVPAQGRIWWAQRGDGAFEADISGSSLTNERRIAVDRDSPDDLPGSRLSVIPTDPELSQAEREFVAPLGAVTLAVPWSTHAALLVARGQLDLVVQTRGQVWDYAATSLIVEEAGGCFGGLDGQVRPTPGPALFARSAALHASALRILNPGGDRPTTT